jgi:hypothetical protein
VALTPELRRHFSFIASMPCLCCMTGPPCQCAHVRVSSARYGIFNTMARKPGGLVLPFCWRCHHREHQYGSASLYAELGIDPIGYAMRLWGASGDAEAGLAIVADAWKAIRMHRSPST